MIQTGALRLRLDAEHSTLRLAVLLSFIGATAAGFIIVSAVLPSAGLNLLALIGALFIGYAVSLVLERLLKGRWHSGREVELTDDGTIRLLKGGAPEREIERAEGVNVLFWRFEISKRARMPRGWSMMALALERDGEHIALYTFMSPSQVNEFEWQENFKTLTSRKSQAAAAANPLRDDLRRAGEERRLYDAEQARWMGGGELNRADFLALLDWVRKEYADWMPA